MARDHSICAVLIILLSNIGRADDVLFSYDGDVLPSDPSSGLNVFDECEPPCQESLAGGFFRLSFPPTGTSELANYQRWISQSPIQPPLTLWVEWRFRSNHSLPSHSYGCDGSTGLRFRDISEPMWLYGDAALSFGLDDVILGLPLEEFFTLRFESTDGLAYIYSVNGVVFSEYVDNTPNTGSSSIQFRSQGGCTSDWIPNKYDEWDFVRYGNIGFGERVIATNPPTGFLDENEFSALDSLVVTFDSPNFVHIEDIAVETTCDAGPPCTQPPSVAAVKRLDNGPANLIEIVLDQPLPLGERTTFTLTDVHSPNMALTNTVAYTFRLGDYDADGDWDLADFAPLQNCFHSPPCPAFDFVSNGKVIEISLEDYAEFVRILTGPAS